MKAAAELLRNPEGYSQSMVSGLPQAPKDEIQVAALSRKGVCQRNEKINAERAKKMEAKVLRKRNTPKTLRQWKNDTASSTVENDKDWKYESPSTREKREELAKLSSMPFWNQLRRSDGFYEVTRGILPHFVAEVVKAANCKTLEEMTAKSIRAHCKTLEEMTAKSIRAQIKDLT